MLSRRDGLCLAAAAAAAGFGGVSLSKAQSSAAPTVKTPVNFDVPPGAVDSHTHVFPDPQKFPFWSGRGYTPPVATADDLLALQKALHLDHVVIVTPSVYGTDNSATLDGIKQLGPQRARGIAVIDEKTSAADLDEMHKGGVRGIRINLEQAGVFDPAAAGKKLEIAAQQIQGRPWHLQMYARLSVIEPLKEQFEKLTVPVVFDHFAGTQAALGHEQPSFGTVLDLVGRGKAYVKVSGAYRASTQAPNYSDVTTLATALANANPDRLVWGSDWPHPDAAKTEARKPTDIAPALEIDDGRVLNLLAEWVPDAATRKKILVDNPKRLYEF
jgi:predicted TIM-barrel fold metal-dependent hydrolase